MQYFYKNFYSTTEETHLAKRLREFAEKFKNSIHVGSYPVSNNRYVRLLLIWTFWRIGIFSLDRLVLIIYK